MAKKIKKVAGLAGQPSVNDDVNFGVVATSERPEVYDERADANEAEQKAAFAKAALKAQLTPEQRDILNSRESLKHPLADGQGFFESPEGYIIVAQADRDRVWCQKSNGGKGLWINPKR